LGNAIEGGELKSLVQPTAAMIVFGGTLGATLLSSTLGEVIGAMSSIKKLFLGKDPDLDSLVKEIINTATAIRKDGILSMEKSIDSIKNPFFAGHLRHIVDGYDPNVLKEIMEDTIMHTEEEKLAIGKVWETAGGFSPTVGILGAVLGLIHVMSNLSDSSKLGSGIAVAFVATVYGVGSANLLFLPMANKLKKITKAEMMEMQVIYYGLLGIQGGLNPRVIEDRLHNMVGEHGGDKEGEKHAA
jgi:chemotaxis protein MotA